MAPLLETVRSSRRFVTFVVCLTMFTDVLLYGIIVPIVPFILGSRVDIPESEVQKWTSILLASYGVAMFIAPFFLGYVSDRIQSRRTPYVCGLLVLAGSTSAFVFGHTVWILIFGRFCQGLSAAVIGSVGLAIISTNSEEGEKGQDMGYASLSWTLASTIGPSVGGFMYEHTGYYSVFILAYALIGLDIFLFAMISEKSDTTVDQSSQKDKVDHSETSPLLQPLQQSPTVEGHAHSTHHGEDCEHNVQSKFLDDAGVRKESVAPSTVLLKPRMLTVFWASFTSEMVLTSIDAVLPLYLKRRFHWHTGAIALMLLSMSLPSLSGPGVGRLSDRYGARLVAISGFALATPSLILLRLVDRDEPVQVALMAVLLVFLSISLSLVSTPMMAEVSHILDSKDQEEATQQPLAQAYGLVNAAFAAGSFVGPLWGGFITTKFGWSWLTLSLGLFIPMAAIPVYLFIVGRRRNPAEGA